MTVETKYRITRRLAEKVLKVVDVGLTVGRGRPVPGEMCVEAAVCYALGIEHSDSPPCVGPEVRDFKIVLNDSHWKSDSARAKGMRAIAIAQLGSNKINQHKFVDLLFLQFVRHMLPLVFYSAWQKKHYSRQKLVAVKRKCREVSGDFESISFLFERILTDFGGRPYACAIYLKKVALCDNNNNVSKRKAFFTHAFMHEIGDVPGRLELAAECCLDVLKELKSPGCKYLDLL